MTERDDFRATTPTGPQTTSTVSHTTTGESEVQEVPPLAGTFHPGILAGTALTQYVEATVKEDFGDKAVVAISAEVKQYFDDLARRARERARIDEVEGVSTRHVREAVRELREKNSGDWKKVVSDWTKRIGFLFVGFAVQEALILRHQNPMKGGSVVWFAVQLIVAAVLITSGAKIDGALDWISNLRRRGDD
jgi:hypothetical protein